jgi:hypothetical protein
MKIMLSAAAAFGLALATPAIAQNFPLIGGDYVEVTGVSIDDGHNFDYAQFLAGYWRAQEEYSKSQGWSTSFEILSNVDKRKGEPDLYLVRRFKNIADGPEGERRSAMIREHVKQSDAQMEAASGDRAKYRHIDSTQLLQVLTFR